MSALLLSCVLFLAADPPLPTLPLVAGWKAGDYGVYRSGLRVVQVVDDQRILATTPNVRPPDLVMLTLKIPGGTAGLVDGREIDLTNRVVSVTGTVSYNSLGGVRRTVVAADLVPAGSFKKP